jgi:hypothetical protein
MQSATTIQTISGLSLTVVAAERDRKDSLRGGSPLQLQPKRIGV